MKTPQLLNYARDQWVARRRGSLAEIASAIDGSPVATTGIGGVDFGAMLRHAREVGGPALRKHDLPPARADGRRRSASPSWPARRSCTSSTI